MEYVIEVSEDKLELIKMAAAAGIGDWVYRIVAKGKPLSVTPIRPKGHWLMPDENYSPKIWRKCSCCGTHIEKYSKHISFDGDVHYIENIMNYCRICGSDMREVEE